MNFSGREYEPMIPIKNTNNEIVILQSFIESSHKFFAIVLQFADYKLHYSV